VIPRRAIFFWEGQERSWLREQSMTTFRLLNPTWQIEVIDGSGLPIEGDDRLSRVLRSDWARYRAIFERGGVYFDTDIVFWKPIPDEWLSSDAILPLGTDRQVGHVAVLGGDCGNRWFELLDKACEITVRNTALLNYQDLGIRLVNTVSAGLVGQTVKWVPEDVFLPVDWHQTQMLWSESGVLPPMCFGVHWYGGDWLSMRMESLADPKWLESSRCMVARAIRKAWSVGADAEVLREQHGV